MTIKLVMQAIVKLFLGIVLTGLLLFLSMPLVLGSIYSFLIFIASPFIIAKRIKNEE